MARRCPVFECVPLLLLLVFLLGFHVVPGQSDDGLVEAESSSHPHETDLIFGTGPLPVRDPFPLARIRLSPAPTTPVVLPQGKTRLRTGLDWTSTFAKDGGDFIVDSESRILQMSAHHGIFDGWELGGQIGYLWRGGGVLDPTVDGFHRITGLPEGGREDEPRDQFLVRGFRKEGIFADVDDGSSVTDAFLSVKRSLGTQEQIGVAAAIQGEISIPLARSEFGAGSIDGGVQLLVAREAGRLDVYGGLGWTAYSDTHIGGFEYSKHRVHGFFAFEWWSTEDVSFVLQFQGSNRLLTNIASFPSVTTYIVLGTKWDLGGGCELETTLIENLWDQDATSDFGLRLGLTVDL